MSREALEQNIEWNIKQMTFKRIYPDWTEALERVIELMNMK